MKLFNTSYFKHIVLVCLYLILFRYGQTFSLSDPHKTALWICSLGIPFDPTKSILFDSIEIDEKKGRKEIFINIDNDNHSFYLAFKNEKKIVKITLSESLQAKINREIIKSIDKKNKYEGPQGDNGPSYYRFNSGYPKFSFKKKLIAVAKESNNTISKIHFFEDFAFLIEPVDPFRLKEFYKATLVPYNSNNPISAECVSADISIDNLSVLKHIAARYGNNIISLSLENSFVIDNFFYPSLISNEKHEIRTITEFKTQLKHLGDLRSPEEDDLAVDKHYKTLVYLLPHKYQKIGKFLDEIGFRQHPTIYLLK